MKEFKLSDHFHIGEVVKEENNIAVHNVSDEHQRLTLSMKAGRRTRFNCAMRGGQIIIKDCIFRCSDTSGKRAYMDFVGLVTCPKCKGLGLLKDEDDTEAGDDLERCPACNGSGFPAIDGSDLTPKQIIDRVLDMQGEQETEGVEDGNS
jgi:DnaJ-class molecular chaperone